jgi:hypothetical protein
MFSANETLVYEKEVLASQLAETSAQAHQLAAKNQVKKTSAAISAVYFADGFFPQKVIFPEILHEF